MCSAAAAVPKHTRFEASLESEREYQNPVQEVSVTVEVESPSAKRYSIPAFWDGGRTWRFRFSPDEAGAWKWSTRVSPEDSGLGGKSGSFECEAYAGKNPVYRHGPLKVAQNGHHFQHSDGTPFFWLGDTVWNGVLLSDAEDWTVFLRDRADKRFSVIQYVTTRWSAAHGDQAGRAAYTGRERIDIDPTFFQRMDERVDAINEHGLIAAPILLWAHPSRPDINPGVQLPDDQAILLARYMVARYGAHQVVWFLNGDGDYLGKNAERWRRIGRAVFTAAHPNRLSSMHPARKRSMVEEFAKEPWFHFAGYQSGHRDDDEHLRWLTEGPPSQSWKRAAPIPDINIEPNYEAHRSRTQGATHVFDAHHVRRAAYWSLMVAPPAGVTYGAHGIWSWELRDAEPLHHKGTGVAPAWDKAMLLPGSVQMKYLADLFLSLPWTQLRPAQDVLADQPGRAAAERFVTVLQAQDNSLVMAYLPAGLTLRFQAAAVDGLKRARWYNPRAGRWRNASARGTEWSAPDEQDWVLLLQR
jgi:hypothetical protein